MFCAKLSVQYQKNADECLRESLKYCMMLAREIVMP